MEILTTIAGCKTITIVACFVFLIVFAAILIDLVAGLRKAKQNGTLRTSEALRRTVNKFIQYEGGLLIAFAIDLLLHFSQIWEIITKYNEVPIFTLVMGIYNLICELVSVRENADKKHQRQRQRIDKKILEIAKTLSPEKYKKIVDILEGGEEGKKDKETTDKTTKEKPKNDE